MTDVYVTDPIVPVELGLHGGSRFTLYQPGWQTAGDDAAAFLGADGSVYAFGSLADLRRYVQSAASHSLTSSPYFAGVRDWSLDDYVERLCEYPLDQPPELSDRKLAEHEQLALGSSLALLLDLLDFTGVEDERADRLRDDDDINRLAQGSTLDSLFGTAKRRQRIVDLVSETWPSCVAEVSRRITTPPIPVGPAATAAGTAGAVAAAQTGDPAGDSAAEAGTFDDADNLPGESGGEPLEDHVDALTVWFAFADVGVYTVRTIDVAYGHPTYLGRYNTQAELQLLAAREPEDLRAALAARKVGPLPGVDLAAVAADPAVTFNPADDNIFDLVEIGESITPDLDVEDADRLVSAWTELVRLADWASWTDVKGLLDLNSTVGRFVVSCAIDLAQDRPHAHAALASVDTDEVRQAWSKAVDAVFSYVQIIEPT